MADIQNITNLNGFTPVNPFGFTEQLVYVNVFLVFSKSFDRKAILEPLKEIFAADSFKIDEVSLSYKLIDDQLYIQGLAVKNEEVRTAGFRFGKWGGAHSVEIMFSFLLSTKSYF